MDGIRGRVESGFRWWGGIKRPRFGASTGLWGALTRDSFYSVSPELYGPYRSQPHLQASREEQRDMLPLAARQPQIQPAPVLTPGPPVLHIYIQDVSGLRLAPAVAGPGPSLPNLINRPGAGRGKRRGCPGRRWGRTSSLLQRGATTPRPPRGSSLKPSPSE